MHEFFDPFVHDEDMSLHHNLLSGPTQGMSLSHGSPLACREDPLPTLPFYALVT